MAAPGAVARALEVMAETGAVVEWVGAAAPPPGGGGGAADCWLEAMEKPPWLAEPGTYPSGEPPLMTGVATPEGVIGVEAPSCRS